MKDSSGNHYEQAFANWLIENHVKFTTLDRHKKTAFSHSKVKSFDFLVYPPEQQTLIAEVKGRKFKGTSLARLAGLECWITADDVAGMTKWQKIFPDYAAAFIFVYGIENIDVDLDGREAFDFDGARYIFFAVKLADYRRFMKRRSSKWKTVTLPADKFRQCAVQLQKLLL
jgi:hypothetical protein